MIEYQYKYKRSDTMKKILSVMIVLCILASVLVSSTAFAHEPQWEELFKNVDEWALSELKDAYEQNLVPENLLYKDFNDPVTRAEFAAIAVVLYEKLIDEEADCSAVPFTDVENDENLTFIEKAYTLGITTGVSETEFKPDSFITREQIAAMLCRVFKKYVYGDWTLERDKDFPLLYKNGELFADDAQISDYAKEAVYFLSNNYVIFGMGDNKFTENHEADCATREQAVALSVRCLNELFADEIIDVARLYPNVSKSNRIPSIDKFVVDCVEDVEEALLYDEIRYVKITSANISNFSFLKDMDVELIQVIYNELYPFDFNCVNADKIEQLYFHNVDLINTHVASSFNKLSNFVLLNSANKTEPQNLDFLSDCVNIENIEIQNYGIQNLDFAKNMTKLSNLSVKNSSLEDIGGISNCNNLSFITLERGKIQDISAIANLKNLTYLDISDNYIENVDAAFELMDDSLICLEANENYITKIIVPDISLSEVSVCLSKNYISEIPEQLLTANYVDLSYNNIREVPEKVKSAEVCIDLFDNLLDEETIREISANEYVSFGYYDIEQAVAVSNKIREIMTQFEGGTEYEKTVKITKYVMDSIRLDSSLQHPEKDSIYGALFEKVVCTGSTELTNSLLRHCGIKVKSYHGDMLDLNDNERHVWTFVNIDGNYYHCDAMQSMISKVDGYPGIVLLTDDEIVGYGHILYSLNGFEADNSVKHIVRQIIEKSRQQ